MKHPDGVSDTLFIPLEGRLYATEKYPEILMDKQILKLKEKCPEMFKCASSQTEYALLTSACRAFNLDNTVRKFLKKYPDGTVVNIGAGLETAGLERKQILEELLQKFGDKNPEVKTD